MKTPSERSARALGNRTVVTNWRRVGVAVVVGAAMMSMPALAQINALPADLPKALQIGPAEEAQIADFVKANSTKLSENDAKAIEKDRAALIGPLSQAGVSTAFRISYEAKLYPILAELIKSEDEQIALNAMVIAGELATDRGAALIKAASTNGKESVRTQAAISARRTFEAMQTSPVAISAQAASDLAKLVGERLTKETATYTVDAWVKAGFAGASVTKPETPALRGQAIAAVRSGLAARADVMGDAVLEPVVTLAVLRACVEMRNQVAGVNNAPALPQAGAKDAAALAGHVIAHIGRVTSKGNFRADADGAKQRDSYAQLLNSAELVVVAGSGVVNPTAPLAQRKLGDPLKLNTTKDDAIVVTNCREFVGREGLLLKAPWNLQEQFKSP